MSRGEFEGFAAAAVEGITHAGSVDPCSDRSALNTLALKALSVALHALAADVYEPSVDLGGERFEIRVPDATDAAKVEAFNRIAAFVGMAGRVGGSAPPARLLIEIGNIVATVKGVPNPNADDTEAYYANVSKARLSAKQRRLVGFRDEK